MQPAVLVAAIDAKRHYMNGRVLLELRGEHLKGDDGGTKRK